ncbi:MAG: hypothetical protein ACLVIY_08340 [Anaerobutyricum soehngenii]
MNKDGISTQDTDFLEKICEIYVEQNRIMIKHSSMFRRGLNRAVKRRQILCMERLSSMKKQQEYDRAYEAAKKYVEALSR